jgi:hypothetical protein
MGSWANTLFVKSDDAAAVATGIESLLLARGFKLSTTPAKSQIGPGWMARQDEALVAEVFGQRDSANGATDDAGQSRSGRGAVAGGRRVSSSFADNGNGHQTPFGAGDFDEDEFDDEFDEDLNIDDFDDDDDFDGGFAVHGEFGDEDEGRAVAVFKPSAGWVGVMDSALEGNIELASELSLRLATDTMLVMVNDSDSWYYWLHRNGVSFDEFDSAHGDFDDDGAEPTGEWLAAIENEDEDKLHELLMSKAPQNIKLPSADLGIPFQLATLGAKIATGQATFWERLKYRWLSIKFLFKVLTGGFSEEKMDFGYDIPHTEMDDEDLDKHIERTKAFFPKANEGDLRKLLPKCRFPSEDLLRKYLAIVGLPWFYAYLSYSYLSEHSEQELASHGIVQARELRFDPPGAAA